MTETLLKRSTPPPLEPQLPLCPLCKDEVYSEDDYFRCGPCSVEWPATGIGNASGAWELDDWDNPVPQCASTIQPYVGSDHAALQPLTFRCDLNEEHLDADPMSYPSRTWDGTPIGDPTMHRNSRGHDWEDDDTTVVTPAASAEERKVRAEARHAEGERLHQEHVKARDAEWAQRKDMARRNETVPVGDVL